MLNIQVYLISNLQCLELVEAYVLDRSAPFVERISLIQMREGNVVDPARVGPILEAFVERWPKDKLLTDAIAGLDWCNRLYLRRIEIGEVSGRSCQCIVGEVVSLDSVRIRAAYAYYQRSARTILDPLNQVFGEDVWMRGISCTPISDGLYTSSTEQRTCISRK